MSIHLFGIPVYKTLLRAHSIVQEDFKEVLEDDSNFAKVPTWYSNVDTTYGNNNANQLPFKQFIRSAIEGLNEYLEVFDVDVSLDYQIECWLNRYKPGQFQEIHNHAGPAQISCAYMLKTPPNSGNFVFHNNTYDYFHQSGLPGLSTKDFKYNNRITPPCEEGDIIYFPSNLGHYVSNNQSSDIRATISANFVITERQSG
jgi:hypothetical protein